MAAAVATPSYTTGQVGMFGGTKDGQPGYVDYATKKNNINPPAEIKIRVEDARTSNPPPSFKENGYEFGTYPTKVTAQQFTDFETEEGAKVIKEVYVPECIENVKKVSGAAVVIPFDWQTRKQDKKTKDAVEARTQEGALPIAHVDRDAASAPARLKYIVGEEEGERLIRTHRRWGAVNVWRPVHQVAKWPLVMVNHAGVPNWTYDENMARIISQNDPDAWRKGQKPHDTVLVNHDNYKYHYVSNQKPEEAWFFAAFDSDETKAAPHGAFWDDSSSNDAPPRLSFELRTWCFYDPIEGAE